VVKVYSSQKQAVPGGDCLQRAGSAKCWDTIHRGRRAGDPTANL